MFREEKLEKRWGRGGEEMYGGKREKEGLGKGVIEKKKGSNGGKKRNCEKRREKRNREKGGKEEKTEKLI